MDAKLNKILSKQKNENQYRAQIIRAINGYCWANDPSFYSRFGISDITGLNSVGRLFAIELKLWKGTSLDTRNSLLHNGQVTPNQHAFLTNVDSRNGLAYVGVIFRHNDIMCMIKHNHFLELGTEKLTLGWAFNQLIWTRLNKIIIGDWKSYKDVT